MQDQMSRKETNIVKRVNDMKFHILSDTIKVSSAEADEIIKIICDELKDVTRHTGSIIAEKISAVNSKISATDVNGGTDGKEWLIKVSNNPLEFID